jgi:serine/threonine-protein phosphatase 6 regulatory ankyrin repeat subunit B
MEQWDKAIADYSKAIDLDPNNVHAWRARGSSYMKIKRWDEVATDYSKAIELEPEDWWSWHERGFAYIQLGQWDKVVTDYSKVIELKPEVADCYNRRARAYRQLGQWDKAIADYSKAIELEPNRDYYWHVRGLCYLRLNQPDKAIADYTKAIELKPNQDHYWHMRGLCYLRLNQPENAIADYTKAIELEPENAHYRQQRIRAYRQLGQWDNALADLSKAIELDPNNSDHWRNRAIMYFEIEQLDKAIADYSKVIELNPNDSDQWRDRGHIYFDTGQWDKAVADYSKAIELEPNQDHYWHMRGLCYLRLNQPENAVVDYTKAIELNPKIASCYSRRAIAYQQLGQLEQALADISKAIELNPENANYQQQRIRVQQQLGKPEETEELRSEFEQSFVASGPSGPGINEPNGFETRTPSTLPKTIGYLDSKDALVFRGNDSYSKQQICKALYNDKDVICAITPKAPLSGFLKIIESKVRLGYLNDGFHSPSVKASYVVEPEHVLISIVEGPRYTKGPLVITGASDLLKEELTQCLNNLDSRVVDAMGIPDVMKSIDKGDLNAALTRDVYMALLWGSSKPPSFAPSFVKTSTQYLHNLLKVLGYYNSEFTLKLVPDHAERTVRFHIDFQTEGKRASIGTINISGNKINSDEQVLTYLGVKTGRPIDGVLIQSLQTKLMNSGRFRFMEIKPEVNTADPLWSTLNITLEETSPATPLDQELTDKEALLQKVGQFMARYQSWEKDVRFQLHFQKSKIFAELAQRYGVPIPNIEGVYSSQKGIIFSESVDEMQTLNTVVITPEYIRYLCPPLNQNILCEEPKGKGLVELSVSPSTHKENGWFIKLGTSVSSGTKHNSFSYQPTINIHPALWFNIANDPESKVTFIDDKRAVIKTKNNAEIEVDRQNGEIIELRHEPATLKFQQGAFDERIAQLEKSISEHNYIQTNTRTGIGLLLNSILPMHLTHTPKSSFTLDQKKQIVATWVGMLSGIAECTTSKEDGIAAWPEKHFPLPIDESLAEGGMMPTLLAMLYQACHDNLPRDSWIRTLSHVSMLMASGHAQSPSVSLELQELYDSDQIGPVGYLLTSKFFQQIGFPGFKAFAQRGLQTMSADDFRKDWKPLLTKDSKIKDSIRCSLEKLRTYSAEDIQLAASVFPSEFALLIEMVAQRLKETETEQLQESLDPILTDFWEKSFKEMMRQQLNELLAPPKKIVSDGNKHQETPIDKEIPTAEPSSVAGDLSNKNTQLIQAAEKGDIQTVQTLLASGAEVNAANTYGVTALMMAASKGHKDIVKALLEKGADVNVQNNKGQTLLLLAAWEGDIELAKILLEQGADLHAAERPTSITPIWFAAQRGYVEMVELFLEKGADINVPGKNGVTPLTIAAENGRVEVVKLLLERGAEIDAVGTGGATALKMASYFGHLETVRLLLEKGACIEVASSKGGPALYGASLSGHVEVVKLLLSHGANVDSTSKPDGTTLLAAVSRGHTDVVKVLLDNGADANLSERPDGMTPLYLAVTNQNIEIIKLLIDNGADVNMAEKSFGSTPLGVAARDGHVEIVRLLLEKKPEVDKANPYGVTPLYNAVYKDHTEVARMLLEAGANPNTAETTTGCTPLRGCAEKGNIKMIELLLENGADINKLDSDGVSPLCIAALKGQTETVKLLLENGSDIEAAEKKDGVTPLMVASQWGHAGIVSLLLERKASVNTASKKNGQTALFVATSSGHVEVVKLLLAYNADPELCRTTAGDTPLWAASAQGHIEIVKVLLEKGVNIEAVDKNNGVTPLTIAAEYGHIEIVKLLLSKGADVNAIDNKDGTNPLEMAKRMDHVKIVSFLEEYIANKSKD